MKWQNKKFVYEKQNTITSLTLNRTLNAVKDCFLKFNLCIRNAMNKPGSLRMLTRTDLAYNKTITTKM